MRPRTRALLVSLAVVAASVEGVASAEPTADPAPATPRWYDVVKLDAFIDAYASVNYGAPRPAAPDHGSGGNQLRAYDVANGFAVHWAGLDASVAPEPVGGTVSLRFGPSALLHAAGDANLGLTYVKQAFASWRPLGKGSAVTLDLGKFDQPFGSEVADTQYDMNYTRSLLYWYAQPLFFTGLRVGWAASDAVTLKLFAVNGWNLSYDDNEAKSFGAQVTLAPTSATAITLGYMGGPEQPDTCFVDATARCSPTGTVLASRGSANTRWRHLADVVIDVTATDALHLLLNADYVTERVPDELSPTGAGGQFAWYGANAAVKYAFTEQLATALRGEYFRDRNGYATLGGADLEVVDGTLTLAVTPAPHLVLKLDQRVDHALGGAEPFQTSTAGRAATQVTTTLGVVATTD